MKSGDRRSVACVALRVGFGFCGVFTILYTLNTLYTSYAVATAHHWVHVNRENGEREMLVKLPRRLGQLKVINCRAEYCTTIGMGLLK